VAAVEELPQLRVFDVAHPVNRLQLFMAVIAEIGAN